MATDSIAVLGAGIGGLAFAALAARAGRQVRVFDQFETARPLGSGLVIQPVGQAVLRAVGAQAAFDLGQPIRRMQGDETSGRRVLDVSYDHGGSDRFGLAIHRSSLFQSLLGAAQTAGAELRSGHKVSGRRGSRVRFADGSEAGPFNLIVDALGAGSPLSPLKARMLPYCAIWGTVPWPETGLPRNQLTQRYRRADCMIGALPIGRMPGAQTPLAAIFWSLGPGAYQRWRAAPIADWKAEATTLWPEFAPFLATITSHEQMTLARYSHGTLARPIGEGIAHIGDAAHRASPQLGQGANMALLDAHALWLAVARNHHLPDALSGYAKARRWHVLCYQAMSAAFTPLYQSDSRVVLPVLRDRVFMPLSLVPPIPRVLSRLVCGDLMPPYGSLPADKTAKDFG
ncbi:Oxidoreductase [Candidatus Rhodobacter oscarellae]|uniref:Oxidoreductase n=1 Tax=Candidatus Rhodobacter oscarellae TaxID=1675527 RepID=A0A0J9E0R4_9RHOB|nr:NAD(P)/FAD-dependent oxidoreductase [Candidatus Rhodobacter lobularis]KMW56315.1 Oxidoreductase [Candidatus Rhodobacter lobularis]